MPELSRFYGIVLPKEVRSAMPKLSVVFIF